MEISSMRWSQALLTAIFVGLLSRNASAEPAEITFDEMRFKPPTGELRLTEVADVDGALLTLTLRRFEVFTADASVEIVGPDGNVRAERPPAVVYYRGQVLNRPSDTVFLSLRPDGSAVGIVQRPFGKIAALSVAIRETVPVLQLIDVSLDGPSAEQSPFRCSQGDLPPIPAEAFSNARGDSDERIEPIFPDATVYRARVAVETDFEFRQRFSSSAVASTYIGDLVGYASSLYLRQVETELQVSYVRLWETPADPWNQSRSNCSLYEFGKYWNDNMGAQTRTIAHMLSGKNTGGGIAWVGVLCSNAFNVNVTDANCPAGGPAGVGNFGGAYGFTGNITGSFNPSTPTSVWDIFAFAHEVGHNFNSPHTHCYSGIGGNSNAVDTCYGEQGGTCHAGTNSLPGPEGQGSGTIMSYCHLLSPGMSNISLTLGGVSGNPHPFGSAPLRVPQRMRAHVLSRAAANPACLSTLPSYRVGGNVIGLNVGTSVVLQNLTTGELLTVGANGSFTMTINQLAGSSYNIAVSAGPSGQVCRVSNSSGVIGTTNISNVEVRCRSNRVIASLLPVLLGKMTLPDLLFKNSFEQ